MNLKKVSKLYKQFMIHKGSFAYKHLITGD
jgi:hypothetical protein